MSRNRHNPNGSAVSLFPFLAVLLCTMGALIVLLVAMSHVSRNLASNEPLDGEEAAAVAAAEEPPPEEEAETIDPAVVAAEREAAEKRREQLAEVQEASEKIDEQKQLAAKTLRDEQLRLSQIEDHIRRLTDRVASHRATIAELLNQDAKHYDDRAQAERNLKRLEELIADTKKEIDEIQAEQGEQFKSYAVVPYKGKNGTRRVPIYIECLADAVVLRPEGVRLEPEDFQRPLGVGNPLAAALRASREYVLRNNPNAGYDPDAEPYPLILVRPEGTLSYYRVREALRSWDSDFGYELITSDLKLKFPPPNPALAQRQSQAIGTSRERRALLARAAPRAYSGAGSLVAAPGRGGGRRATGGGFAGGGAADDGQASGDDPFGTWDGGSAGEEGTAAAESRPGGYSPEDATNGASGQLAPAGGVAGTQRAPSQTGGSGAASTPAPGDQAGQIAQGASGPSAGQGSSPSNDTASPTPGGTPLSSFNIAANTEQQEGWAVDRQSPSDIAIRRPVQVVVHRDRLVVLDDAAAGVTVPLDGPTRGALNNLVDEVRSRVRSWGIAGQGLYWRPVLKLQVGPDGYRRAQDLARLLQRSGIDIDYQQTAGRPATGGANATR